MTELEDDLRATSENVAADAERLQAIEEEKSKAALAGRGRSKELPALTAAAVPFELPPNWVWLITSPMDRGAPQDILVDVRDDKRLVELSAEAERLAKRLVPKTQAEREIVEEAQGR